MKTRRCLCVCWAGGGGIQLDEMHREKKAAARDLVSFLTYTEFLEALCRCARGPVGRCRQRTGPRVHACRLANSGAYPQDDAVRSLRVSARVRC